MRMPGGIDMKHFFRLKELRGVRERSGQSVLQATRHLQVTKEKNLHPFRTQVLQNQAVPQDQRKKLKTQLNEKSGRLLHQVDHHQYWTQ